MTNTKLKQAQGSAKLNAVTTNPIKTTAYNDINLKEWKNYPEIKTDTFWQFPTRLKTMSKSRLTNSTYCSPKYHAKSMMKNM